MSVLRLFDASQYLYSGVGSNKIDRGVQLIGGEWVAKSMPCAGITLLLNTVMSYLKETGTDIVFCMDSPPTVKRELHERLFPDLGGYKGNRPAKPAKISCQANMVKEMFEQIGIPVIKLVSYEADDIIASIVKYYAADYDKVYIHSRDSDMYYLVSDNVEVVPVVHQGKHITRSNWESSVLRDYRLAYNTITLDKMCFGEQGDNIPSVPEYTMDKIWDGIPKEDYPAMGDNELLRSYIVDITDNDEIAVGIFDLIAPRIIPFSEIELCECTVNERLLEAYAVECGCRGFTGKESLGITAVDMMIEKYIEEYLELQEIT